MTGSDSFMGELSSRLGVYVDEPPTLSFFQMPETMYQLVTVEDYQTAPVGTVVWTPDGGVVFEKINHNVWRSTRHVGEFTNRGLSGKSRDVHRWGYETTSLIELVRENTRLTNLLHEIAPECAA